MKSELERIQPWLGTLSVSTVVLLGWFHASLWFSQGGGGEESLRMAFMAVASDVAKVFFFAVGTWLILVGRNGVKLIGAAMLTVSVALVLVSVTGVFGALQVAGARSAAADPASVGRAEALVSTYQKSVADLSAERDDMPRSWMTKRAQMEGQIAAAVAGLERATVARQALDGQPKPEGAFFSGVASFLGVSAPFAQRLIYGAYAVLLELVSLFSTLVALFGARLGVPPEPARNPPALAVSGAPGLANVIQRNELPNRSRMRQAMARFLKAAYAAIETGQGDAFLGRNKVMLLSGLDRTAVDWCQRQLVLKGLVSTGQNPQRTVPKLSREETMKKLFPQTEVVQ